MEQLGITAGPHGACCFQQYYALSCQPREDVEVNFTRWGKLGVFVQDNKFGGKVHHLYPLKEKKVILGTVSALLREKL